jgi:hypothetical protein
MLKHGITGNQEQRMQSSKAITREKIIPLPRISTTKQDRRKAVFAVNCAEKLSNQWYYQITRYFDRLNLSPLHIRAKPSANQLAYRNLSSLDKKLKEAPLMPWLTGLPINSGAVRHRSPGHGYVSGPGDNGGSQNVGAGQPEWWKT